MVGRFTFIALATLLASTSIVVAQTNDASGATQRATASHAAATECAAAFAQASSFSRNALETIPREAVEHCADARDIATQDLIAALPDHEPEIAGNWMSAKMRVAAADTLISRLELGEFSGAAPADDPLRQVVDPAARLIYCMRVALGRELERTFFGSDWVMDMRGQSPEQIIAAFIEIGRRACPASEAAYVNAFDQVMRSADGQTRDVVRQEFSPAGIYSLAVRGYVEVVPGQPSRR